MFTDTAFTKFDFPTSWRHGKGLAGRVGRFVTQLGCKHPLLLTDKMLIDLGLTASVTASLEEARIDYEVCDLITYEPTVGLFDEVVRQLDLESFDAIIAVGGGSVLDVSKGLALVGSFGGHIRDYAGFDKVPAVPTMKTITIPTTAGTGSEISDGVVLIDTERETKFLVISKKICPTMAITDPLMTVSMPPKVTALSGVDALVHAVEAYVSKGATPVTDAFSLKAVELLSRNIQAACTNGDDIGIRNNMQIGATMAMVAGMNAYLGLCHAMAMPLCALYHMPHGQAVGMALPAVLHYNSRVAAPKISQILEVMGLVPAENGNEDTMKAALKNLEAFFDDIGIWAGLKDFDYHSGQLPGIVQATMDSAQRPTNPRDPLPGDIETIIMQMM
jgi:alcohol dehydrogenase class IV